MEKLKKINSRIEFTDLPELTPYELYGLYRLAQYCEPYTNRVILLCDWNVAVGNTILRRELRTVGIKYEDVKDIVGVSARTASNLMKALKEKNIIRRAGKNFYLNPRYVRALGTLVSIETAAIFEEDAEIDDADSSEEE